MARGERHRDAVKTRQRQLMLELLERHPPSWWRGKFSISQPTWNNWLSGRSLTLAPLTLALATGVDEAAAIQFALDVEEERVRRLGRPKGV